MTLAAANRLVAHLGGYLGRKRDGEPGVESVGRGQARLRDMVRGALTLPLGLLRRSRKKKCV